MAEITKTSSLSISQMVKDLSRGYGGTPPSQITPIFPDKDDVSKKGSIITVFPQKDKSKEIPTTPPPEKLSECDCYCKRNAMKPQAQIPKEIRFGEVDLSTREKQLYKEFEEKMNDEITKLTDRFDFILNNEQLRASYMLAEAHRERQEIIKAVKSLLQCKNMTGMMYVMCSERRKAKLDKLRIVEEYTDFIDVLLKILKDAQDMILKLSRGYKTAARVDQEWREKVTILVKEFQDFVTHFAGGPDEQNQFYFDVPKLIKTRAAIKDDPNEDPIEMASEEGIKKETTREKQWYEELDNECPPFVIFGDMADFEADHRREVLRSVKANAEKTAPKKWKEYVFDEMRLDKHCLNVNKIKQEYDRHTALPDAIGFGPYNLDSRRMTTVSVENIGMGSLLKFMASNTEPVTKATLLAARDSIEVVTKKIQKSQTEGLHLHTTSDVTLVSGLKMNPRMRRTSFAEGSEFYEFDPDPTNDSSTGRAAAVKPGVTKPTKQPMASNNEDLQEIKELEYPSATQLSRHYTDSLEVMSLRKSQHVSEVHDKVNNMKYCPAEKCQLMQMDSFIRSLPSYMKASPFTQFLSTYENYEACTPEQIDILKRRLEDKRKKRKAALSVVADSYISIPVYDNPFDEWEDYYDKNTVALQTSDESLLGSMYIPCTCGDPPASEVSSDRKIYDFDDLIPVKVMMNEISQKHFYDETIEFNRFKVLGQKGSSDMESKHNRSHINKTPRRDPFATTKKLENIRTTLKKHPSLAELFQHGPTP